MKYPITPRGIKVLRKELNNLKSQRPDIAKEIEIARGHGDLSENADYDAAKERSGMVEAKIRDLEMRISAAEVIDPLTLVQTTRVVFGSSVKISDIDSGEEKTFCVVGETESSVKIGLIANTSPIARGLLGREVGEIAKLQVPGGVKEYEILEIFVDIELHAQVEE